MAHFTFNNEELNVSLSLFPRLTNTIYPALIFVIMVFFFFLQLDKIMNNDVTHSILNSVGCQCMHVKQKKIKK